MAKKTGLGEIYILRLAVNPFRLSIVKRSERVGFGFNVALAKKRGFDVEKKRV